MQCDNVYVAKSILWNLFDFLWGGGGEEVDRWRDSNSQFSDFYHLSFQLTSANASHFSDTSQDSGCDQGQTDKT